MLQIILGDAEKTWIDRPYADLTEFGRCNGCGSKQSPCYCGPSQIRVVAGGETAYPIHLREAIRLAICLSEYMPDSIFIGKLLYTKVEW